MIRSKSRWNISAEDIKMALHAISSEEDLPSCSSRITTAVDTNILPSSRAESFRSMDNIERREGGEIKLRRMSSSFSSYIDFSALSLDVLAVDGGAVDDVTDSSMMEVSNDGTTSGAIVSTHDRRKLQQPHLVHSIGRISSYSSLAFQLQYVAPSNDVFGTCVATVPYVIFPNLHATVSAESSLVSSMAPPLQQEQTLLPPSGNASSNYTFPDTTVDSNEERYGWFVEMEVDSSPSAETVSLTAVTESHGSIHSKTPASLSPEEAELLWAQAAETIDNVL
jgi:hypothetical protein